ncbi:hypothetical protein ABIA24_006726 [Sinorhizobium fredii]|uniref:hypothetical protein n=1 Tax=Rhizobium fredii TaxID=380 RepID=UPI00351395AF
MVQWKDKVTIGIPILGQIILNWKLSTAPDGFDFEHEHDIQIAAIGMGSRTKTYHINTGQNFEDSFVDLTSIPNGPYQHHLKIGWMTGGINCRPKNGANRWTIDIGAYWFCKTYPSAGPIRVGAEIPALSRSDWYIGRHQAPQEFVSDVIC